MEIRSEHSLLLQYSDIFRCFVRLKDQNRDENCTDYTSHEIFIASSDMNDIINIPVNSNMN